MDAALQNLRRHDDGHPSPKAVPVIPSHLQNLPQELLEATAQFLPSEDLFNLRLTSTEMASRTTDLMSRTYFRDVYTLMMDPASIGRLLEVLAHPVFKEAIRVIKFSIAVPEDEECNHHVSFSGPGDEDEEGWKAWITTPAQQEIYDQHINFRDLVKTAVYCILTLCRIAGVTPEIRTLQGGFYSPDSQVPWGTKRLDNELGERRLTCGNEDTEQKAYGMLLHAIFASDFEITRLALGHCYARLDPRTLVNVISDVERCEPFKHLTHLELNLRSQQISPWEENVPEKRDDIKAHADSILWMIAQAESLESLSLICQNDYITADRRSCDTVFFKALVNNRIPGFRKPLTCIKNLSLLGHDIPKRTLLEFVQEHRSTLKSLYLWEVIDGKRDDPNMKKDLFAAAKDITDFRLKMGRVYEGTRPAVYSNHKGWALPKWESLDPEGRIREVE